MCFGDEHFDEQVIATPEASNAFNDNLFFKAFETFCRAQVDFCHSAFSELTLDDIAVSDDGIRAQHNVL